MAILLNVLLVIFVIGALLMVFVILMQRPKSEGLGAAFGGGVTDNIFGAQTTNVLTKVTGWLAGIFFLLTFVLSILYAQRTNPKSGLRQELMKDGPAAAMPAVSPGASNSADPAPSAPEAPGGAIAPAPAAGTQDNLPPVEGASSPTAADMSVGAVQPIPPPAATPANAEPAPAIPVPAAAEPAPDASPVSTP